MIRRGVSLVEVLFAVIVFSLLSIAFYGTLVSSLRGIAADRLTEAKRFVTQDLLERFCHPYSDLPAFMPAGAPSMRDVTLDEALAWTGVPAESARQAREILRVGGVTGFTLVWEKQIDDRTSFGPRSLHLHRLTCIPKITSRSAGPRVDAFRIWSMRGDP